jgi:hypothetical protein
VKKNYGEEIQKIKTTFASTKMQPQILSKDKEKPCLYSIPDKYLGRSPNFSLDVQDKSWTPEPIKYLGRSPNFSLDVQDKSWTPEPISFSETL